MRYCVLLAALVLLAGCGSSQASNQSQASKQPSASTSTPAASSNPLHFTAPPPMTIDTKRRYTATVETTDGTFTIQLLPKLAPLTVNNFIFLARHHYFDGNLFHRIIQNFMVQTGDPTGSGSGGPGYEIRDELHKVMRYVAGTVAMANLGQKDTNGSQFFIVTGSQALGLAPTYTIFGRVIHGMNVVYKIANTPVTTNLATGEPSQPLVKVLMKRVTIH